MPARSRSRQPKPDEGRSKTVTLRHVAEAAGVTSMTVSRVIKGMDGVGAATRERVLRIASELNYTANLSARALATGRTGVIAIISGSLDRAYYASTVHLLESQISASGYQMRLLHRHSDLKDLVSSTNASAVDGVIIAGKYLLVEEFRALAPEVFRSCVFIDTSKHPHTDYVHSNLEPAVEEALGLMLQAGRERLAYIGHFQSSLPLGAREIVQAQAKSSTVVYEERMLAYLAFMERQRLEPELIGVRPQFSLSPDSLRKYLQARGCPRGLLCVNDETAMWVYRVLRDEGLSIPGDVMLVGCDGLPFMECFDPPLSTIEPPMPEICALAWKFLQARIASPDAPPQQATFDARLIVRQSLRPTASQD